MVTVAFYKATRKALFWRAWGAAVRWWTGGPYSHAELVVQTPQGFLWASSASPGGVRLRLLDERPDPARWDTLEVDADSAKALSWYLAHEGCKYDYLGLLGFLVRKVKGSDSRYFCSESVASSLGFEDPWRFDPNTLYAALSGHPHE